MTDSYYEAMTDEMRAAADETDSGYDGICPSCGYDEHCSCPMDINTQSLMSCPSCGGKWWREWGSTSTKCLHWRACGKEGSTVIREPLYAPAGTDA